MNDEIKLAGLEALLPKELARKFLTYVEAKVRFLKIVIPSRLRRVHVDTQRLERSTFSHQSKVKGHPFRVLGVFFFEKKSDGAHFQRNCNASKNTGKQSSGKGNQSKSWSTSESSITSEEKFRTTMENPWESPKESKVRSKFPKAQATVKH